MPDVLRFPSRPLESDAARLGELRALLASVASAASLDAALDALARWVEGSTTGRCSINLVDDTGRLLKHAAAPSLPPAYTALVAEIPVGDGIGACGTAAATRQPVFCADLATDPRFALYRAPVAEHGLRACWSQPILDTDARVLGTFALYFGHVAEPAPDERALLADAAHVAALVIERARTDEARRTAELGRHEAAVKLRRMADAVRDVLLLIEAPSGRVRFANAAAAAGLHDPRAPLEGRHLTGDQLAGWVHPDDRGHVVAFVQDALRGVPRGPIEVRQRLPDGRDRWMRCRHVVLATDPAGMPQRVLFVGSDVSAEHALAERAAGPGPGGESPPVPPAVSSPPSPAPDRFRACRVLVVDDEPDVVRVVSKRLQRVGCQVDTAADGEEALSLVLAAPTRWDVIVTDQTMPRRTGEQLLLAMREAGVRLPVVVMSGYSATVTPERMLALGAAAFLPKPFDGAQLLAALGAALGR